MAFVKGGAPGPGRPKGTTNPMKSIRASLAASGFDLADQLKKLLVKAGEDLHLQLQVLTLIAKYTQVPPRIEDEPKDLPETDGKPDLSKASTAELYSIIGKGKPSEPIAEPTPSSEE